MISKVRKRICEDCEFSLSEGFQRRYGDGQRQNREAGTVMRATYVGGPLRRFREDRQLKQIEFARMLGISSSYLNQIEQNQRPLTLAVMSRLRQAYGVEADQFSGEDEARLLGDLRAALAESAELSAVGMSEIRELATGLPGVGRALLALHRRYREAVERGEVMAEQLGSEWAANGLPRQPFEQVRDYFAARHHHFAQLDEAAERLYGTAGLSPRTVHGGLMAWLAERHQVRILFDEGASRQRSYDPESRTLRISADLRHGQQAFQMATQLAFLEQGALIDRLAGDPMIEGEEARKLARIGLANYFAGALIMPYGAFLAAAEAEAYDVERLGRRFGVGFETICHRLSTLQRPEARGVPFFFIRVDRAGNISKRQSATGFHFSRIGGGCPLWNVYEAFAQPGRVLTQVAQMPDGRSYLWIARTVSSAGGGHGAPGKSFAIGLGCDLRYASRLVYSKGLDLQDPAAATPMGAGCKIWERPVCTQRAFPPVGRRVAADPNRSSPTPYAMA